jgi:UDP-glucose 4-epimerase
MLSSSALKGYTTILHKNYSFSKKDFADAGVDGVNIVIHSGAFIPKKASDSDNVSETTTNITSVGHLINHLPNVPDKFIFFSTVDVYGTANEKITEKTLTQPVSLYGWSKLYGEKILESWANKENVTLQILRVGHIYGQGEEQFQKIIPLTIRKVKQHEKPVIFTKGEELRSFLHVSDCVRSVVASIGLDDYKGPINIVSGTPLSVKEIVSTIVDIIDPDIGVDIQHGNMPVRNLTFDNSKMKAYLDDEHVSFEEGIREEIKEFKL